MSSVHELKKKEAADFPDDPRLMQAVEEYLGQLEAGRVPNRQEILRRYPDLSGPLTQCLDGLELVHKAALPKKAVAPPAPAPSSIDALQANPLGDFQILREIGRGGMGIVYEALQLSLGRRVALKVLPFAATFDAKHLQRFHNEAHAAAQLHHSNIVPVYAVGCERGVHFYAMQLIEGQSLAAMIQQIKGPDTVSHGTKGTPNKIEGTATGSFLATEGSAPQMPSAAEETVSRLSLALTTQRTSHDAKYFRAVAKFMIQAAEALEYAHQIGIVHRDIKPANLLVDVHHRLWITDFGLAQFHTNAELTMTGDILGTLRYMSPEQASGQRVMLDHRTDIYSLGATMYEMVTTEPIFPGRNRQELLHQIINDEARLPRQLDKNIPVELETIILKAVSKNPADRYHTAQEFAEDLQRYLEDKPVLAKRPSMVERARKWSRRHPSVVVACLLVLIVSLVGLGVSNWRIAQEQAKTKLALQNEQERAKDARHAVDMLVDISDLDLDDSVKLRQVRKRLLQVAVNYYRDFLQSQGNDPDALTELAVGKGRAGKLLDELAALEGLNLIPFANWPQIQSYLKITPQQQAELSKLHVKYRESSLSQFGTGSGGNPDDREKKYLNALGQQTLLTEILDESQLKRLKQLELQSHGAMAFHESSIIDALKLTIEQRRKIRDIKDETMNKYVKQFPPKKGPGGGFGDFNKNSSTDNKMGKEEVERIEKEVLTADQRTQWDELVGPRVDGIISRPGGPPPKGGKGPPGKGPGT
jgi:eukaryotic-like serine/threonine-protein kinase